MNDDIQSWLSHQILKKYFFFFLGTMLKIILHYLDYSSGSTSRQIGMD